LQIFFDTTAHQPTVLPPHLMCVSAPGKTKTSDMCIKMNKTSQLHCLTVMQHCVNQMTFRNVDEFKKWLDWSGAEHHWHCYQQKQKSSLRLWSWHFKHFFTV